MREVLKPRRASYLRKRVFERDLGFCAKCQKFDARWHHDHIIALADDGRDDLANSQTLCRTCHTLKTGREAGTRAHVKRLADKHETHLRRMNPANPRGCEER